MPNGRRSVPVRKVIAMAILPRWGVGSVNLHQYDPFPLVYPEDKLIVDERIAPIVGRQFKLHVMTHSNHFSLSASRLVQVEAKKKFIILMVYKVIVRRLMFSHGMPRAD